MIYVLGTQFIIDLSRSSDNNASKWIKNSAARNIGSDQIKVSCMSWLVIERGLQAQRDKEGRLPGELMILEQRIHNVLRLYKNRKSILPIDIESVDIYLKYLMNGDIFESPSAVNPIPLEEKLVLATVIAGFEGQQITLVNPYHAAYERLGSLLGLRVEDHNVQVS